MFLLCTALAMSCSSAKLNQIIGKYAVKFSNDSFKNVFATDDWVWWYRKSRSYEECEGNNETFVVEFRGLLIYVKDVKVNCFNIDTVLPFSNVRNQFYRFSFSEHLQCCCIATVRSTGIEHCETTFITIKSVHQIRAERTKFWFWNGQGQTTGPDDLNSQEYSKCSINSLLGSLCKPYWISAPVLLRYNDFLSNKIG